MASDLAFYPAHTAVIAGDCQTGLVSIYAKPPAEFAQRAAGVLKGARKAGMRVVLVQFGFRPGMPEASSRNPLIAAIKSSPEHQKLFQGQAGAIHPALGPEVSDVVIAKRRVSAFAGTDLETILRAGEIDTLVLFGIATSGVVLSTLLDASDRDFRIFVIADCCADLDAELHKSLLIRVFPQRATVINANEFEAAL